jgi:hypothetical protein
MELTMREFDKAFKCKKRKNNKVAKKNKDRQSANEKLHACHCVKNKAFV